MIFYSEVIQILYLYNFIYLKKILQGLFMEVIILIMVSYNILILMLRDINIEIFYLQTH